MAPPRAPVVHGELLDQIARAIHDGYRRDQVGRKPPDDPAMREWDQLPEDLRESNRAQATDIAEKLHAIGCALHEVGDRDVQPFSFSEDEIELMSRMEHARWMAERRAAGWTLGEKRDVANKITPHLVAWEELPEEAREWDREPVRRIPELLAAVGLELRRRT